MFWLNNKKIIFLVHTLKDLVLGNFQINKAAPSPPDKSMYLKIIFSYFSTKTSVEGTQKKHFNEGGLNFGCELSSSTYCIRRTHLSLFLICSYVHTAGFSLNFFIWGTSCPPRFRI